MCVIRAVDLNSPIFRSPTNRKWRQNDFEIKLQPMVDSFPPRRRHLLKVKSSQHKPSNSGLPTRSISSARIAPSQGSKSRIIKCTHSVSIEKKCWMSFTSKTYLLLFPAMEFWTQWHMATSYVGTRKWKSTLGLRFHVVVTHSPARIHTHTRCAFAFVHPKCSYVCSDACNKKQKQTNMYYLMGE